MTGPPGVRALEFEALGPVPFCGMLLADMGADVLSVVGLWGVTLEVTSGE